MSFGTRLKEKREALGITQPQLADMLGVSKGAIGNWETDVNSPRATLLYDLFDILHCDANYLFQDEMHNLKYKDKASPEEFENIIKKYRELDTHGKEMVDFVLDKEYSRTILDASYTLKDSNVISMVAESTFEYGAEPAAAHERTDVEVTDSMRKHDDDIMDSEDF